MSCVQNHPDGTSCEEDGLFVLLGNSLCYFHYYQERNKSPDAECRHALTTAGTPPKCAECGTVL